MTHIPQGTVLIIVPFYDWGRLVQRAYIDKLVCKYGEDNVRSLSQRFRIVTPEMASRSGALRGYDNCLVLLHNKWSVGANFSGCREVEYALHVWSRFYPNIEIQRIGEDYY